MPVGTTVGRSIDMGWVRGKESSKSFFVQHKKFFKGVLWGSVLATSGAAAAVANGLMDGGEGAASGTADVAGVVKDKVDGVDLPGNGEVCIFGAGRCNPDGSERSDGSVQGVEPGVQEAVPSGNALAPEVIGGIVVLDSFSITTTDGRTLNCGWDSVRMENPAIEPNTFYRATLFANGGDAQIANAASREAIENYPGFATVGASGQQSVPKCS